MEDIIASGEYLPALNGFTFQNLNEDRPPDEDPAYVSVAEIRDGFERDLLNLMETTNLDALVYPPILSNPPTIRSIEFSDGVWESSSDFRNMNPSPFLGFPSITVPAGFRENGIPFGIEFLGRPYSEPTLISLAYAFEEATSHRRPPGSTPSLPGEVLVATGIKGDFNGDQVLDADDVDELTSRLGTAVTQFDMNGDEIVDQVDRQSWVLDLARSWFGDANLDGEFNSGDLVAVFQAGQYEDTVMDNSGWASGDWDGDGDFTSGDLVVAFQHGGYEQGPRSEMNAVPEPPAFVILMAGLIGFAGASRRRWKLWTQVRVFA